MVSTRLWRENTKGYMGSVYIFFLLLKFCWRPVVWLIGKMMNKCRIESELVFFKYNAIWLLQNKIAFNKSPWYLLLRLNVFYQNSRKLLPTNENESTVFYLKILWRHAFYRLQGLQSELVVLVWHYYYYYYNY